MPNDNLQNGTETVRQLPAGWRLLERISALALRHRFAVAYLILVISILPLLPAVGQWTQGDVSHYQHVTAAMLAGKMPYRDTVLEYPPYAIPFFLLPRAFGSDVQYPTIFMLTVLVGDWLIKLSLIIIGFQNSKSLRCLLPLLIYAFAVPAIHFFYLQRYDIWPALICVAAIWLFASKRYTWSGLMLAVGIGVKLYPAVFIPPLFILALRQGKWMRFCTGLAVGFVPLVILSFFLPWWRFAEFQGARGLQVESLYASILWLGKFAGLANIHWAWAKAWFEVQGPSAAAILPWARAMFASAVVGSTAFASWMAMRLPISTNLVDRASRTFESERTGETPVPLPQLARLLLIPLLAFVAFNQVLSPQYMIWLLPLAAMASLEGNLCPIIIIPLATLLTPHFFPTAEYATGLNLTETIILFSRNYMLIITWSLLIHEMLIRVQTRFRKHL
jgi:Glycosyltransferase family 87